MSETVAGGPDGARARDFDVAVVGMSGRFPGADGTDEFWTVLRDGRETITHFTDDELRAAGVPEAELAHPDYVRAIGRLRDVQHFDAGFFGYSPREAETLDPAHRLFLEVAWEALEDAGHAGGGEGRVGVYAGAGHSGYAERHVLAHPELRAAVGDFQATLASGKDFLATRTSYKLDLRGPSVNVQTACSTSLVAVHLAVQALLSGECDLALAGGSNVLVPQDTGYLYAPGSIASPDGHCRAYDARSAGTLSGSGVGVVVLKRLADALADGDPIRAVIRGSAVNNDGAAKVAFTAPGVEGQAAVIGEALAAADVDPATVTYVEGHGSGTDLGDTIEVAALTRAFRAHTDATGYCALGAVKSNVGHLDAAAGITGFIKTVLALENAVLPPTVHFEAPNPKIAFAGSPFYVTGQARPWTTQPGVPRRAGVSSFGIGGTNAHVVLEEAPAVAPSSAGRPWQLLTLSARTPQAVQAAAGRLAAHLAANPDLPLADVAFTLREGRRALPHRRAVVVREGEDAAAILAAKSPERTVSGSAEGVTRSVAFLFPGLGDHHPEMARGLYESESVFRAEVDRCAALLRPHLGVDLRTVLFPGAAPSDAPATGGLDLKRMLGRDAETDPAAERLNHTLLAQPAVFVVDYALAMLWRSLGVEPAAVIGHSLGEYVAATVAGILSLEDALALVADRAKLIDALPGGAMLAVSLDPEAVRPYLADGVSIATVNAPALTVLAGAEDAIEAARARLEADGRTVRRLPTTHAFHSPMMAPAAEALAARVARVRLRPPAIPMVSNVTGTWITDQEATDTAYWTRHLLGTVRFAEGVETLLAEPGRVLLEVGPGQTLSTFVRQRPAGAAEPVAVVPSLKSAYDRRPDAQVLLEALGRLWTAGVTPDWTALRQGERRRRVRLPTYPWERQRYWVEAPAAGAAALAAPGGRLSPDAWVQVPAWTRAPAPAPDAAKARVLVLSAGAAGDAVAAALEAAGREVILARAGDRFVAEPGARVVRPHARGDHRTLLASLVVDGLRPDVVVDARPADALPQAAFASLLVLAEAMGTLGEAELVVVTAGAADVTGEEPLDPKAAALLGLVASLPHEFPELRGRVVDVVRPAADAAVPAAAVAREVLGEEREPVVAIRGRHRWLRAFRPVRGAGAPAVREGGAYLLLGEAEGRNATLAHVLAARPGVRLALAASHVPEALLASLRGTGAEVAVIETHPNDPAAVARAVAEAEARFGRLDGVAVTPELGEAGELALSAEAVPTEWAAQVAAVARALAAVDEALAGRETDFVLVESSLAGLLGVMGRARHAAANAITDAYAARRARDGGPRWTAVAWDRWLGPDEEGDGIRPAELGLALERVLAHAGEPVLVVSTLAPEARIRDAARRPGAPAAALYARPELDDDYAAPTNEVEARLAELWQELLGIERVGIHDDFFGLGGHSLLATQIISRVRTLFQVDLRLAAIFEAPTVARLAALIEDAIIAELEALSDEEAALLVGGGA